MACEGCYITHRDLVLLMDNPERRLALFTEHMLVKPIFPCPTCGRPCAVNARNFRYRCDKLFKSGEEKEKRCGINKSALTGTMLMNVKIPLNKLLDLIYFWLKPGMTFDRVAYEVRTSKQTIQDYFSICREVAVTFCSSSMGLIGGEGAVVEIYEAEWDKNLKKGKLAMVPASWAFGGIECGTNKLFLVPVRDVEDATLVNVIKNWVQSGTTIIVYCWTSRRKLDISGYTIKTVYLSLEKMGRRKIHNVGYLAEWLFKKVFKSQPERFHNFLVAAAAYQATQ